MKLILKEQKQLSYAVTLVPNSALKSSVAVGDILTRTQLQPTSTFHSPSLATHTVLRLFPVLWRTIFPESPIQLFLRNGLRAHNAIQMMQKRLHKLVLRDM